ncbi:hypothetical protein XH97_17180 [Bradyrhizobium sp. CCBAU 53380]|nr:hypothetical protein [Bradyrhizobium sp. CCBAU 53380]
MRLRYSFLMADSSINLRQRSVSAVGMLPNSSALPCSGIAPSSAMRALISASGRASSICGLVKDH